MPTGSSSTSNNTFGSSGKAAWPLPPSSVFKCRPATPWINPNLFHVDHSFAPIIQPGVLVIGHAIPEETNDHEILEANQFFAEYKPQKPKPLYRLRSIEFSDNPERGIDLGNDVVDQSTEKTHIKTKTNMPKSILVKNSPVEHAESRVMKFVERTDSSVNRSDTQHRIKRKWSPFNKGGTQSWKLFY